MTTPILRLTNLAVTADHRPILKSISLTVAPGEVVALMGPNGSGKSTLAQTLLGHPNYRVTSGTITFAKKNLKLLAPHQRAALGLFVAYQNPITIPGLPLSELLLAEWQAGHGKSESGTYRQRLATALSILKIDSSFLNRAVNDNFSGGEKKKAEMLQLLLLQPKIAVLDETDSGLDTDALRIVAAAVRSAVKNGLGVLVITHYRRLLELLQPKRVIVLAHGQVAATGGKALITKIDRTGYSWLPTV